MDNKLLVRQNSGGLFVRPNFWLVTGFPKHHTRIRYWSLSLPGDWCMLQTCKLCCLTMLSLSTLTILHYSSANTVRLTLNRNMITSVPGLPETGLPLTVIKLNKLFFVGLPQDILIVHLLCQTLNELHRLHYLDHSVARQCELL